MDRNRMKNMILMVLTAAVLTVWAPADSYAQEYISTPVSISKEKVRVGGKVCYSHIVLERQTLFSIAKAYNVTIDEIYEFNPTLKETGLKKNSIILIPSKEAEAAPVVEQPAVKESTPAPAEVKEVKEVKKKKMKK